MAFVSTQDQPSFPNACYACFCVFSPSDHLSCGLSRTRPLLPGGALYVLDLKTFLLLTFNFLPLSKLSRPDPAACYRRTPGPPCLDFPPRALPLVVDFLSDNSSCISFAAGLLFEVPLRASPRPSTFRALGRLSECSPLPFFPAAHLLTFFCITPLSSSPGDVGTGPHLAGMLGSRDALLGEVFSFRCPAVSIMRFQHPFYHPPPTLS